MLILRKAIQRGTAITTLMRTLSVRKKLQAQKLWDAMAWTLCN